LAVTVSDVVIKLNGETSDGGVTYDIFGHNITSESIEREIARRTRFYGKYFSESVQSAEPLLFDDVILLDVCLRILSQMIMGILMLSGFSYSTLELNINKSNFPDMVKNTALGLLHELNDYISLLTADASGDASTDLGEDNWQNGLDKYDQDSWPDSLST